MRPRELQFDFINQNCVEFRGYWGRELYVAQYKRPPVYNTRTRSWVTTPDRARDLAALAESRGWMVTFSGAFEERQLVPNLPVCVGDAVEAQVVDLREVGLW